MISGCSGQGAVDDVCGFFGVAARCFSFRRSKFCRKAAACLSATVGSLAIRVPIAIGSSPDKVLCESLVALRKEAIVGKNASQFIFFLRGRGPFDIHPASPRRIFAGAL